MLLKSKALVEVDQFCHVACPNVPMSFFCLINLHACLVFNAASDPQQVLQKPVMQASGVVKAAKGYVSNIRCLLAHTAKTFSIVPARDDSAASQEPLANVLEVRDLDVVTRVAIRVTQRTAEEFQNVTQQRANFENGHPRHHCKPLAAWRNLLLHCAARGSAPTSLLAQGHERHVWNSGRLCLSRNR